MKFLVNKRLVYLTGIFLILLVFQLIMHPVFLLRYFERSCAAGWMEVLSVPLYGIRLDVVIASYLSAIPLVVLLVSLISSGLCPILSWILKVYYIIVAILLSAIFTIDLELFGFWDFRFDASVLLYMQKPREAVASIGLGTIVLYTSFFILSASLLIFALLRFHRRYFSSAAVRPFRQITLVLLLLSGGFLFLGMRSSIQTSTANVGMVYHSQNQFINQASVNPAFNLFATLSQERDFISQTSFFTAEERASLYQELNTPLLSADSVAIERPNIKPKRPNIVLILLESFSANAIGALGGTPGLTPSLDSIAEESVLFTHTYASSFRTDRGIAAAISGYPGQPASSILKYPEKSRTLPSIARTLKQNGYGTYMLYGGDIDFTNMRSYFLGTGYEKITEVNDFPLKQRTGKWGVRDEHTFALLAHACKKLSGKGRPFLYTFLTLSSHEPFDVPIEVHSDPYLNSIAYTDGCIGKFMREMKNEPAVWDNTLFVFVSDHGYPYPKEATPESLLRYKIIMMWAGGALERGMKVDRIMAQTDLPASLMASLGLPHDEFIFSKDIFSPESPSYAFFSFPNLFGLVTPDGSTIYNFTQRTTTYQAGENCERNIRYGKAFLQTLMEDMQIRGNQKAIKK